MPRIVLAGRLRTGDVITLAGRTETVDHTTTHDGRLHLHVVAGPDDPHQLRPDEPVTVLQRAAPPHEELTLDAAIAGASSAAQAYLSAAAALTRPRLPAGLVLVVPAPTPGARTDQQLADALRPALATGEDLAADGVVVIAPAPGARSATALLAAARALLEPDELAAITVDPPRQHHS